MPLGKNVSDNIRELIAANQGEPEDERRPRKQIVAIAMSAAGKSKKKVGMKRSSDQELLWMHGQGS